VQTFRGWPCVSLQIAALIMLAAPSMSLATGLPGSRIAAATWAQVIRHGLKKIHYRRGRTEGCLAGTGLVLESGETPTDIINWWIFF
jgi:hypothetical protein